MNAPLRRVDIRHVTSGDPLMVGDPVGEIVQGCDVWLSNPRHPRRNNLQLLAPIRYRHRSTPFSRQSNEATGGSGSNR